MSSDVKSVESAAGNVADYKVGDKHEITVGEITALLICSKSGFHATGNRCTHYGAELKNGVLCGNRIKCPWHQALFNLSTGDIEDAPSAVPNLPTYPIRIDEKGNIFITAAQTEDNKKNQRFPFVAPIACQSPSPFNQRIVIVGGGVAGIQAARTLRENQYQGSILLLTDEAVLPYDRTKLSKSPDVSLTPDKITLKDSNYLNQRNIEVKFNAKVQSISTKQRQLTLVNGETLHYDQILVCTGSRPRYLGIPGEQFSNVFAIRSVESAKAFWNFVVTSAPIKNIAVIGSGFIGLELAAFFTKHKEKISQITLITPEKVPFEHSFGTRIGSAVQKRHEKEGIAFKTGAEVAEISGDNNKATGIKLKSGEIVAADAVIVAVGAQINTEWLKTDPEIELNKETHAVIVDQFFRNKAGIYAAGDIAQFPWRGQNIRIEHYNVASNTGKLAALNMLGHDKVENSTPCFWTVQYGSWRYCGYSKGYDQIVYDGQPEEYKFAAYYCKGEEILAVLTLMKDPIVSIASELMKMDKMPTKSQLIEANYDLNKYLQAVC
jgi:NADPH-dependent 2,4-dienoyl-CoA reductase/sulfur reductase-like enzyme/nitrite reductase/ring-hydroxylating ferredoxin subunit